MIHTPIFPDAVTVDQRLDRLLALRGRTVLATAMLSVAVFTLVDLFRPTEAPDLVLAIHAAQLAALATGIVLLTPDSSHRRSVALLLPSIVFQSAGMLLLGCIVADPYTTPVLLTVFSLLAAVLLPWGWKEHAAGTVLIVAATLLDLHFITGSLAMALSYPALALWVSMVFSVIMAGTLDGTRRVSAASQLALESSEARFRELVQDVDAAVWELKLPSLDLTFLSRDFSAILGYPAREEGDRAGAFLAHVHPEDRERVLAMAGGVAQGKGYEYEYRMVAADGHSMWIHERARVSFDDGGQPTRVRGISVDTTALRRDQEVLARRSQQVETVNAAMSAHVEKKPWTVSVAKVLGGAVRATASEFGFVAREDGGGVHLFAFDQVDPRTNAGRALLREGVRRLIESGKISGAGTPPVLVDDGEGGHPVPLEDEASPKDILGNLLATPIVVGGETIAVLAVGNRPAPYGPDQEDDAAALATAAAVIHEARARDDREADLEKTRAQLVEILNASPDLVSTTDAFGRSIYTNPAGRVLLGIGADEDISTLGFSHFLTPAMAEFFVATIVPAARKDGIWSGEITVQSRAGREIPLAFVFLAHRDETGRVRFFSSTARDISGDREAAEQIRALNEELGKRVTERTRQLEEAMREMEAFSYSVSHDLRAPLRRIDGFCALLAEELGERLDESQRTYLQRVRDGAQNMGLLIDAQLNLARVSRAPIRRERIDLSAITTRLLGELQQADSSRRVACVIEPGLAADADVELVTIALDNLLSNAWKYTRRRDDARIEFGRVDAAAPGGDLSLPSWFVRDNGAGFDMAYAKKLFGTFQRLHHDKEFEGTGVGLATVERIVRRHGGRVWAEAAPGRGATFRFTLGDEAVQAS